MKNLPILYANQITEDWSSKLQVIRGNEDCPWLAAGSCIVCNYVAGKSDGFLLHNKIDWRSRTDRSVNMSEETEYGG